MSCLSQCILSGGTWLSGRPTMGHVYLDYWSQWCPPDFSIMKTLSVPLKLIHILWRDTLWNMKIACSSANFHPLVLVFIDHPSLKLSLPWCLSNDIQTWSLLLPVCAGSLRERKGFPMFSLTHFYQYGFMDSSLIYNGLKSFSIIIYFDAQITPLFSHQSLFHTGFCAFSTYFHHSLSSSWLSGLRRSCTRYCTLAVPAVESAISPRSTWGSVSKF